MALSRGLLIGIKIDDTLMTPESDGTVVLTVYRRSEGWREVVARSRFISRHRATTALTLRPVAAGRLVARVGR